MREIKFRGLNNGKWIYGYLRKSEDGTCWISYEFDSLWYELEVDPETVGEYTGLKDKTGKEIYEWDIVYAHLNDGRYVVGHGFYINTQIELDLSGFNCYGWNIKNKHCPVGFGESFHYSDRTLEIIGNIHENPELLNG